MCNDKNMFALIITIFILVLFITGSVFADQKMTDLIGITPVLESKNTTPAPETAPTIKQEFPVFETISTDGGMCLLSDVCG